MTSLVSPRPLLMVWYVDNLSLWTDLKILALTALKVLKGEGVSSPESWR